MTKKFIAIAPKGQEFVFSKRIMIAVPESSAWKIAELLTKLKYMLKDDNTVWHVYDNDYYYDGYISEEIKRYSRSKLKLYKYYG